MDSLPPPPHRGHPAGRSKSELASLAVHSLLQAWPPTPHPSQAHDQMPPPPTPTSLAGPTSCLSLLLTALPSPSLAHVHHEAEVRLVPRPSIWGLAPASCPGPSCPIASTCNPFYLQTKSSPTHTPSSLENRTTYNLTPSLRSPHSLMRSCGYPQPQHSPLAWVPLNPQSRGGV